MNNSIKAFRFKGINLLGVSLLLAIASIPWNDNLNSWILALFIVICFFSSSLSEKKECLKKDYFWVLPVLYYIVLAVGTLGDINTIASPTGLPHYTPFLVLPLIMASMRSIDKKIMKYGLFSFVFSLIIISVICLYKSSIEYLSTNDTQFFFYHFLSSHMDLNAIDLSLYITFAVLIILYYYFIISDPLPYLNKIAAIIIILFFYFMIILLSSKMIIFLFILSFTATFLYIFYLKKKFLKGIMLIILISLISCLLIWNFPFVKSRIEATTLKSYSNTTSDDLNGLAVRRRIWKYSIQLISKKPLTGYGIKDANNLLLNKYKENHFTLAFEHGWACHNVFLQTLLLSGILGLIPVVLMFFFALRRAIIRKNYLFFTFSVLILCASMTGSPLEVQKGIVFILLFIYLLYYHSPIELEKG